MSTYIEGNYTILRGITRAPIPLFMNQALTIDMEKLKADMAEEVERTSGRDFSKRATGDANPDFYRNFVKGQDKRLSAEVYMGITHALGKDPAEYIRGLDAVTRLPNATALTQAFAMLLETVGIDPFEDERAQKLARQFPNVLKRVSALREDLFEDAGSSPEASPPDPDEDRPVA